MLIKKMLTLKLYFVVCKKGAGKSERNQNLS